VPDCGFTQRANGQKSLGLFAEFQTKKSPTFHIQWLLPTLNPLASPYLCRHRVTATAILQLGAQLTSAFRFKQPIAPEQYLPTVPGKDLLNPYLDSSRSSCHSRFRFLCPTLHQARWLKWRALLMAFTAINTLSLQS
jgi:hypothetical protein